MACQAVTADRCPRRTRASNSVAPHARLDRHLDVPRCHPGHGRYRVTSTSTNATNPCHMRLRHSMIVPRPSGRARTDPVRGRDDERSPSPVRPLTRIRPAQLGQHSVRRNGTAGHAVCPARYAAPPGAGARGTAAGGFAVRLRRVSRDDKSPAGGRVERRQADNQHARFAAPRWCADPRSTGW